MTEKKKRAKVVAEITLAHLLEFAAEVGQDLNHDAAMEFLNGEGRAYEMWKHMMQAGEEYVKSALQKQGRSPLRPHQYPQHPRIAV